MLKKVITDESELALKHQNNIIKLHGSLRTANERSEAKFGFSGDLFTQYIISKEHYNSYEDKHSAFMHLMRISLLQESFCLIGFSGDDPNFKAWLTWVKSIISRNKIKEPKVYFIDLNDGTTLTKDKKLFFDNNSIGVISIRSTEILKELRCSNSKADNKLLVKEFISYLNDNKNTSFTDYDTSLTNSYENSWNEIEKWDGGKVYDLERLKDLEEIKAHDAVFPVSGSTKNILESITFSLSSSIDKFYLEKSDARWYRLFAHATEDLRIPTTLVINEYSAINLNFDEPILRRVKEFDEVFSGSNQYQNSENHFLKLMSLAYSYDFDDLYTFASAQDVQIACPIATSSILALYSPEKAFNSLLAIKTEHCHISKTLLIKKLLYAYYRQSYYNLHSELEAQINELKKTGASCILEETENIAKVFISKKEKPQLIGANRHGVSETITFSNLPSNLNSVRYVYSLFKIGLQQNTFGTYLIPNEEWYKIHLAGYEQYPIPYLFYSLQCSDEKTLKRIGQDYSYNLSLKPVLPSILKNLLKQNNLQSENITNTLKSNILIFCTQILIAVNPEEWQSYFFEHLESNINYFDRNTRTFNEFIELTLKCLLYTDKQENIITVLESFLLDESLDMTMKITYGITSNKVITLNAHNQTKAIKIAINSLISTLENKIEANLFLLGNLKDILTKSQIKKIKEKIEGFNLQDFKYVRILRTIASFGSSQALKDGIMNSKKLWYSGIEGNTYSSGESISLSQFRMRDKNLIDWDKSEIQELYSKLLLELENVIKFCNRERNRIWGLQNIKTLLDEMLSFLEAESKHLENIGSYNDTISKVRKELFKIRAYDNISEAIYSEDESIVADSLSELDSLIYYSNPSNYLNDINLVINRIILETGTIARVEQCIFYIEVWLRRDKMYQLDVFHTPILRVLKKFRQKEDFTEYDLPFVYEKMISIAEQMSVIEKEMDVINFWLKKKKEKIFNNL